MISWSLAGHKLGHNIRTTLKQFSSIKTVPTWMNHVKMIVPSFPDGCQLPVMKVSSFKMRKSSVVQGHNHQTT